MRNTHNVTPKYYSQVHYWLRKHFIKNKCEGEDCTGRSERIEWALVKGKEYEMERKNFICLCKSCHSKYDITPETWHKKSRAFKGKKFTKKQKAAHFKSIVQLDEEGNFISFFNSGQEAAKLTGTVPASISRCLKGKYKFTKNRNNSDINYWKYKKYYEQK